jgi:hypothetical protein
MTFTGALRSETTCKFELSESIWKVVTVLSKKKTPTDRPNTTLDGGDIETSLIDGMVTLFPAIKDILHPRLPEPNYGHDGSIIV